MRNESDNDIKAISREQLEDTLASARAKISQLEFEVWDLQRELQEVREKGEWLEKEMRRVRSGGKHNYQRQPWGHGWLQKDPKRRKVKEGEKVYSYWAFHWVEDGKRKSKHIGSDEQLAEWKKRNPAESRANSEHE
jgi:hypothetical protein